jgi:hypothetical protein
VSVSIGAQRLLDSQFVPLRGWYPVEFFHFPVRSLAQSERKYSHQVVAAGETPSPYYDRVRQLQEAGRLQEHFEALLVDDGALERGLRDGSLVVDVRLRNALRSLRTGDDARLFALPDHGTGRLMFPRPSVVDDAAYAVDVAALGEADLVRVQRRLDALEQRILPLEQRTSTRAYRTLRRVAKKLLRREPVQTS